MRGERHDVHGPQAGLTDFWQRVGEAARPMGVGPTLRVDTTGPVRPATLTRLALQGRALGRCRRLPARLTAARAVARAAGPSSET